MTMEQSVKDKEEYPHADLTKVIIACVYSVYNALGPGFLEAIYENALIVALKKKGLMVEQQKIWQVWYDGYCVGEYRLDLLVEGHVIVELKAVKNFMMPEVYKTQVISYLRMTKLLVGLLVNFGSNSLEIKRLQNKWEIERLRKK